MRGSLKAIYLLAAVVVLNIPLTAQDGGRFIVWTQQEPENQTTNSAIAFSPDGRYVASGRASSNDVKLWSSKSGGFVRTFNGQNNNANVIKFSPDSQYLATGTGQPGQGLSLNLWRVSDGVRLVGRIAAFGNGTIQVSFSRDGQYLAASGFHSTGWKVYHVPDMTEVAVVGNFDPVVGYNARIHAIEVAPDGRSIAVSSTRDIKIRDLFSGAILQTLTVPNGLATSNSLAFSPDGQYLAAGITVFNFSTSSCDDCSIRMWRLSDGALVHTYVEPGSVEYSKIGFSPDGRVIGAGFGDQHANTGAVQFWNVDTEQSLRRDPFPLWIWDFAFSANSPRYTFISADGTIGVGYAPPAVSF